MKTVIAVSIDTKISSELQKKTKGTRSRIVERALQAYLKGESDYSIVDVPTRILMSVLHSRLTKRNDASAAMVCTFLADELLSNPERA